MKISSIQQLRSTYQPKLPKALKGAVKIVEDAWTSAEADQEEIRRRFPATYGMPIIRFLEGTEKPLHKTNVGVLLSGGQAPGGHNVISGLFDELKNLDPGNRLYGFLMGPQGLVDHHYQELTKDIIDRYRNTGGFDMIGSGRTKLETEEQFQKAIDILHELKITALVIIGGDDSNTNACVLAEYFKAHDAGVQVIGVPKTIDGDLKNGDIECSFGFDTACKTYSEVIGNIERDANSARKYWHFIKLMGRSASHIALECALQTHPNICLISEQVEKEDQSLNDIVDYIASVVKQRADDGNNFGVVLVPEGLIESIQSIGRLIEELNDLLVKHGDEYRDLNIKEQRKYVHQHLSKENAATYETLPNDVAAQLALDRDPHGNVQVSQIATEQLLSRMVAAKLDKWKEEKKYFGKFSALHHFFGYEGRCGMPSNFDADYCYTLGSTAAHLIAAGKTGYMAAVRHTHRPVSQWVARGVPIVSMLNMEKRNGKMKPVIKKQLVDLNGAPFNYFLEHRKKWERETDYVYPGPIQYFGPEEVCDQPTITLKLEHGDPVEE